MRIARERRVFFFVCALFVTLNMFDSDKSSLKKLNMYMVVVVDIEESRFKMSLKIGTKHNDDRNGNFVKVIIGALRIFYAHWSETEFLVGIQFSFHSRTVLCAGSFIVPRHAGRVSGFPPDQLAGLPIFFFHSLVDFRASAD